MGGAPSGQEGLAGAAFNDAGMMEQATNRMGVVSSSATSRSRNAARSVRRVTGSPALKADEDEWLKKMR